MKKSTKAMMMALALGLSGFAAIAQSEDAPPAGDRPPHEGPPGRGGMKPPVIVALDADGDGVISAAEMANAPAALKKLDKNGDGQLTQDELRPKGMGPGGQRGGGQEGPGPGNRPPRDGGQGQGGPGQDGKRPPAPPLMAALDADGDGIISAQELANAPAALRALDKNGDGQLTQDELRPKGMGPGGRGPGGPGGPGHRPPPGDGNQPPKE